MEMLPTNSPARLWRRLLWVCLLAMAMAHIESSVVVYLRMIYYPDGFHFPIVLAGSRVAVTEVCRELATLLLLTATAFLAGQSRRSRIAYFCITFGVWDLFYYFWLWVILGWPPSLLTWDILFLIPVPWVGPVLSPALVSVTMIVLGVHTLLLGQKGKDLSFRWPDIVLGLVALGILLLSFMFNYRAVLNHAIPGSFPWGLFALGLGLLWAAYLHRYFRRIGFGRNPAHTE